MALDRHTAFGIELSSGLRGDATHSSATRPTSGGWSAWVPL